jgi:hypothetical protein
MNIEELSSYYFAVPYFRRHIERKRLQNAIKCDTSRFYRILRGRCKMTELEAEILEQCTYHKKL